MASRAKTGMRAVLTAHLTAPAAACLAIGQLSSIGAITMNSATGAPGQASPGAAQAVTGGPVAPVPGTYAFGNERQVQPERLRLLAELLDEGTFTALDLGSPPTVTLSRAAHGADRLTCSRPVTQELEA
jgi:hypothetical protein